MATVQKERLGEILVKGKYVTQEQVDEALRIQKEKGGVLGSILVKLNYLDENTLGEILAGQLDTPYVALDRYLIDPLVVQEIPEELARKHKCIPLFKVRDTLTVAMVNPKNVLLLDDLRYKTKCKIKPVIASENGIMDAIDQYYRKNKLGDVLGDIQKTEEEEDIKVKEEKDQRENVEETGIDDAPVVKLVNTILSEAVKNKASDIHIEPDLDCLRVRYRIDGILQEVLKPPQKMHAAIVSRIKIMANLDIAEKRIPQDGRIPLSLRGKDIDIRVSTLPTVCGEKIVMRLLDKSVSLVPIDKIGFTEKVLHEMNKLIRNATGIVLVTGPTGSGKTTTLYSCLGAINDITRNITTVEDPVEYQIPLVNQVQVNPKVDLTFATALRSFLRQDPNVMLVGEIRDKETAQIAVQAALTGHLVFSTLHTNDSCSSITRLIDMGIEPFLIASSIRGILAQRLVRRICTNCKEEYLASEEPIGILELVGIHPDEAKNLTIYKGKGCDRCNKTGYKGRTVVTELLVVTDRLQKYIVEKATPQKMLEIAKEETGMLTLREDAIRLMKEGITGIGEVVRVTQG